MVIAEVSIAPFGVGTSLSKYVKVAVKVLKASGLKVKVGGMSTTIEAPDLDTIFNSLLRANNLSVKIAFSIGLSISNHIYKYLSTV